MKIILCLNYFLHNAVAGTEVYAYELAKYLQSNNINIGILVPFFAGYEKDYNYVEDFKGVKLYKYFEPDIVSHKSQKGLIEPSGLKNFKKVIIDEKPDIIHFHDIAGSIGISFNHIKIAKELGVKTIFTFHRISYTCFTSKLRYLDAEECDGKMELDKCRKCSIHQKTNSIFKTNIINYINKIINKLSINAYRFNNRFFTALGFTSYIKKKFEDLRILDNYCDALICVNEWYKSVLKLNGIKNKNLFVVKQGLMEKLPDETKLFRAKLTDNKLRLIFVGRVQAEKGLDLIMDTLKNFSKDEYSLDVYGTIDQKYYNEVLAKTIDRVNITFNAPVEHSELLEILKEFDFLIMASKVVEMAPLVILESLHAGTPVIAPDYKSIREFVENNKTGFLYNINNKDDLIHLLKRLMKNKKEIFINFAKYKPSVRTIDDIGKEMLEIYHLIYS